MKIAPFQLLYLKLVLRNVILSPSLALIHQFLILCYFAIFKALCHNAASKGHSQTMWTNFLTLFTTSPFFPLFEPFLLMTNLDFWQLPPQIAVYMVCEWSLMQKYLVIQIRPQPAAGWAPVFVCQIQVAIE